MRPSILSSASPRLLRYHAPHSLAGLLQRIRRAGPSPARGILFGLFLSLLLWAAILGFLLAL
ncbi:MAG TPA: hypothetical protein VNZ61_01085 [Roseomonas sp.]|nr:hypothetical protein [Roseomonas sp.]